MQMQEGKEMTVNSSEMGGVTWYLNSWNSLEM